MSKRQRDGTVVRTNKRRPVPLESVKSKRLKKYEYWHHEQLSREEKAVCMAAMYIHLLNIKKINL